jgi:hypothetical protein
MAAFEVITYGRFWVTAKAVNAMGRCLRQLSEQKSADAGQLFVIDATSDSRARSNV